MLTVDFIEELSLRARHRLDADRLLAGDHDRCDRLLASRNRRPMDSASVAAGVAGDLWRVVRVRCTNFWGARSLATVSGGGAVRHGDKNTMRCTKDGCVESDGEG